MEYRSLGGTGVRVSAVVLGTGGQWGGRVDQAAAKRIVAAALDTGINYIDTADIYGTWYEGRRSLSEEYLGVALQGLRDKVVLGTKGCNATEEQVVANARAASWRLSAGEVAEIRAMLEDREQA